MTYDFNRVKKISYLNKHINYKTTTGVKYEDHHFS